MSSGAKVAIGMLLIVIVIVGGIFGYLMNAKFTAETFEQSIYAQDENMQNVHGAMQNSLQLEGLTVKNYTESDIQKMKVAIERYADKPNLMMQFAQESNNGLSPELHSKFMTSVQKFYAKWEATQASKISVAQEYRTFIKASMKGSVASALFNYPTEKANTIMDRIISTKETKTTWQTGNAEVIDPFKK